MLPEDVKEMSDRADKQSHWLNREAYAPVALVEFERFISPLVGLRLLDIGCGQGHDVAKFLEAGLRAEGIDSNGGFLKEGRELFGELPITLGFAEHLPYADQEFDLVYCRNVIFYTDPAVTLPELCRVLRCGGVGHVTLDEKILRLDDNSCWHSADVGGMLPLLNGTVLSCVYGERTDQTPWPHKHHYYDVYFRKR